MKRTSALSLVVAALLGGGFGFLIDHALTMSGRATFTPAVGLPILLVLLGALCVALAWPVRRSQRSATAPRVDPFRAVRIAILAKASSIVGAASGGAAAGMLLYVSTRPVAPALGSVTTIVAAVGAGAVLVVAALVAEHFCSLPPDDGAKDHDERQPDDAGPGAATGH